MSPLVGVQQHIVEGRRRQQTLCFDKANRAERLTEQNAERAIAREESSHSNQRAHHSTSRPDNAVVLGESGFAGPVNSTRTRSVVMTSLSSYCLYYCVW